MWKVFLLIVVVMAIVILLFNSPRTETPKREVGKTNEKKVKFENVKIEEVKQETKKSEIFSPEKVGYVVTDKKIFPIAEQELHLVLYSRNFDAYVKGYWKNKDNWMTIPTLDIDVKTNGLPNIKFLNFDGNYLYFYLGSLVFIYHYNESNKEFKRILNQYEKYPFFPNITNLDIKNNQVIISDNKKFQITNNKIHQ